MIVLPAQKRRGSIPIGIGGIEMSSAKRVFLEGGPKGNRSVPYNEPLPNVLVIQTFENGVAKCYDYQRVLGSLVYKLREGSKGKG